MTQSTATASRRTSGRRFRLSAAQMRTLAVDSGWVAAGTVFCFFGTRGSGDLRSGHIALDVLAYVLALTASIALVVARTFPGPVFALETVLNVTYLVRDYPGGPIYLFLGAAALGLGWNLTQRRSLPAALVSAAAMAGAGALHADGGTLGLRVFESGSWIIVPLVPWLVGALLRINRSAAQDAAEQEHRRQVDEERMRIARDVHDVVGHSLAVISMQAGVALHVAERRPEQARVALETIARSSRDALNDLRSTLAVFRGEEVPGDPTPGLDDLPGLVADLVAGGQHVDLRMDTDRGHVPAAHAMVAYRVVQESLTNAARHAAAAPTRVVIEQTPLVLRIEILDDGPRIDGARRRHSGSGLIGMRERCHALGGTLAAGPRPDHGWRVHAELPLPVSPAGAAVTDAVVDPVTDAVGGAVGGAVGDPVSDPAVGTGRGGQP